MARSSDIVVGVSSHSQNSIHVSTSQPGMSTSHAVVNGVAVSWSGQPTNIAAWPPSSTPSAFDGEYRTALERVLTSRALGVVTVTGGVTMVTATSIAVFLLGAPLFLLAAWVPAALLLTGGGFLTLRRGAGSTRVSDSQVLASAQRHAGILTVAALALDTGHAMVDCQKQLDAMVAGGWVAVDVSDDGLLTYRFASLVSR